MKRVTVAIEVEDGYYYGMYKKIQMAMTNAAVAKCTDLDLAISKIGAKVGTVRKSK
jgi:hypothetical protein